MILTWLYQTYCLCTFRLPALLYRFVRDALFNSSHVTRIRYPTQQISLNFRFSFFLFVIFSSSAKYVHILFVLFYALNWVFIYLSFFFHLLCVSLTQIRFDCVGVSNACRCFIQFLFVTGPELKMWNLVFCVFVLSKSIDKLAWKFINLEMCISFDCLFTVCLVTNCWVGKRPCRQEVLFKFKS